MVTRKKAGASKKKIEISRREPRMVVYANQVGIAISPWDFGFQFGLITEASETTLKAQEQVCVYMSPQHVKAFVELATRQLSLYEEKFGPIPQPKHTAILTGDGSKG
jgi:hypothetical protein